MFDKRRITLRLPEAVADQLIAVAALNGRHPQEELLDRLERSLVEPSQSIPAARHNRSARNAASMTAKTKAPLTLEQINAIDDRAIVDLYIEEWGGTVQIRPLTLQQINECSRRAQDPKRGNEVHMEKRNGWYLVEGMIAPTVTIEVAEVWLTERAAGPVAAIINTILTASGMTDKAKEAAKSGAPDGPDT